LLDSAILLEFNIYLQLNRFIFNVKISVCSMIARCFLEGTSGMLSKNIKRNSVLFFGLGGSV
jgi:hypothetical protein